MKIDVFNAHNKYMIIKHALQHQNVAYTCSLFGISRTTFYNWLRAYKEQGRNGLKVKESKKPEMPNKVSEKIENEILKYVIKFPKDGPKSIQYALRSDGVEIGESGIYNVLKRNRLSTHSQRLEFSKTKAGLKATFLDNEDENLNFLELTSTYPGNLVVHRIEFVGKFEGIGKIYQYIIYDTYSKWGLVKLYNKKQDIDLWDYFELKLGYLMKTLNLNIEFLVAEKTKEFMPCYVKNSKYQELLNKYNIKHRFIEMPQSPPLREIEAFSEILREEFYEHLSFNPQLNTFLKVEYALQKYMRDYNFKRPIGSGSGLGKVPAKVMLERAQANQLDMDTLPLWLMALLNQSEDDDEDDGDGDENDI